MKDNFTHKVMNCKDYGESKFKPGCVSPKLDGVRAFYYPGDPYLWTRNEKLIHGMNHIVQDLEGFGWPVDMELYINGVEFNIISGVVRNHQHTPEVEGHIIDVICPGELSERMDKRPKETANIKRIPHYVVNYEKNRDYYHQKFLIEGYEGSVWKSFNHVYTHSRRGAWLRDVPVKSEDCTVLGVYEGKGKMEGIAGGIIIDFMGIECKCGTMKGMDYDDRRALLDNADYYVGETAEIQYKNLQPSGKPRQPRFKGWRHDK